MMKNRRSEGRNWTKGLLAFFWIALAGFSALYLFSLVSDPTAFGGQTAKLGAAFTGADTTGSTSGLTAEQASQLIEANEARGKELAEIKDAMRELSQQVSDLSARINPNEKGTSPLASLTPTSPATATPPGPAAAPAPAPKKPEVAAATPVAVPPPPEKPTPLVKPAEAKPPEKPAPTPTTVATAEPKPVEKPEAKPAASPEPPVTTSEPAADDAAKKENNMPPPVTVSEADEPPAEEPGASSNLSAPAPPSAGTPSTPQSATTPSPAPAESASLDPVALPPAANDGSTRYGIEIGIVAKQDGLRPLWREFLTNHAALVAGLQPRRVLAPDKKWRLIAGPFANAAEAAQACALFKKASRPCEATVYAGDSL